MNTKARKITMIGMLCAISYAVMVLGRVPMILFLKYDPKDVIITIGGFIFGPLTSMIVSSIVSFVEMVTVSETGPIGCIMNILSSCSFACTAAFIYKKKHTLKGAVFGLICGGILATIVMLLWNYLIAPIYMGYPRDVVVAMLLPVFLPFNLLKSSINIAITLLIYKPIVNMLRKGGLLGASSSSATETKSIGVLLVAALMLVTCIFFVLVLKGVA